jgi:hypothetical protein
MLLTDGIEEWPTAVVHDQQQLHSNINHNRSSISNNNNNDPIRIFGYAMGYGMGSIGALEWLSCTMRGYYAIVDSIADVKMQLRAYIPTLSRVLAFVYRERSIDERAVIWTG